MSAAGLAEVLAAHQYVPSLLRGVSRCACGVQFHGMPHEHRTHLADVILTEWLPGTLADERVVDAVAIAIRRAAHDVRRQDESRNEARARAALAAIPEALR